MSPKDFAIERFKALCRTTPGGVEAVATATGLSLEALKQVLVGTKLPSGKPRGLGPSSVDKITENFPHWLDLPQAAAPDIPPSLLSVAHDWQYLLPDEQAEFAKEIRQAAEKARSHAEHVRRIEQPTMAARRPKVRSAMQFVVTLGDENPDQGHLPLSDGYEAMKEAAHEAFAQVTMEREKEGHPR